MDEEAKIIVAFTIGLIVREHIKTKEDMTKVLRRRHLILRVLEGCTLSTSIDEMQEITLAYFFGGRN